MGRKKSYKREALVERAMMLFWRMGYEGSSIAALSAELGVNKFGLYAEFGSKQGLYEAALRHYANTVVDKHFGRLETEKAGLDDILAVFRFFTLTPEAAPIRLGCLMCNAATERAALDEMSATHVAGFVARLIAAHTNALRNAERAGMLRDGIEVPALASLLVTQLLGMFVLRRAQPDPTILRQAGAQAIGQIEALRRDTALAG